MKYLKTFTGLIIAILLFELAKALIVRTGIEQAFFINTIFGSLEFLTVFYLIVLLFIRVCIGKTSGKKKILPHSLTLVVISSLEILFGYWLNHPRTIPPTLKHSFEYYYDYYDCRQLQFQSDKTIYDPLLFYRLKPGVQSNFANREFNHSWVTNKQGERRAGFAARPEIICLGDSYTLGWGVEEFQAFPSILERDAGMSVWNAGVPSYGTARELLQLKNIDSSGARFLIVQYCENDYEENQSFLNNHSTLKISSADKLEELREGNYWMTRYYPGKHFSLVATFWVKKHINRIRPVFKFSPDRHTRTASVKEQASVFMKVLINSGLHRFKGKIVIICIDNPYKIQNGFIDEVDKLVKYEYAPTLLQNIVTVSLDSVLSEADYYRLDPHLNPRGHEKVASVLKKVLTTHKDSAN
jgi:hypothetical protein